MRKMPPKGRRLLILATTSDKNMLTQMDLTDIFDSDIEVHPVNSLASIMAVVQSVDFYAPQDEGYRKIQSQLQQAGFGSDGKVNIGIKRLLSLIEMARQDEVDPGAFTELCGRRSLMMVDCQARNCSISYTPSCRKEELDTT